MGEKLWGIGDPGSAIILAMPWAEEKLPTHGEEFSVYPTSCQGSLVMLPWFADIFGVFSWGLSAL